MFSNNSLTSSSLISWLKQGVPILYIDDPFEGSPVHILSYDRLATFNQPLQAPFFAPRIIQFLDFAHRPKFLITKKHNFSVTGCVCTI
jgi:hypothetical protein